MRALSACLASLLAGVLLAGTCAGASTQAELRARLDAVMAILRGPEYAKAHAELEPLIVDISATGNRALLAEALNWLAVAKFRGADYPGAFAAYQRALPESRAAGDRKLEARAIWGMAQVRKNQGRYAESLKLNTQARELHVSIADHPGEMRAWMLEGALRDLTGEHRVALDCYERARALMKGTEQNFGLVHSEMGISYRNLGEFARAREMCETATAINKRIGWRYGEAMSLGQLGSLSAALGEYDTAVRQIEESLSILREIDDLRGQAYAYGSLGDVWWYLEDGARATAAYQKQFEMAGKLGIKPAQALALEGLGEIALAAADYDVARERLTRALEIERAGGGSREAALLVDLSTVEWRDGKTDAAGELARQALRLAQEAENPEAQWQARLALARSARDPADALSHLRAGVAVISGIRGRLLTDSSKVGYLDARQELFHELVATLMRQSQSMAALEAAEAARGRAFSDLLAARTRTGAAADHSLLAQMRDEEARLRAQAAASSGEAELRAELTRTRAATESRIDAQLNELRGQRGELASLVVADPVSAAEIRATSTRLGATIVEYLVTGDRLFIWVVGHKQAPFATSVALERKRLRDTVRELHGQFNELDAEGLRNPGRARELLRQLHRWVLEPVAAQLPRKSADLVLLVPHDALLAVPFAALEDSAGGTVLERHTLVSTPSIAALRYTAQKKQRAKGLADARLLAFADPAAPPDAALQPLPGARTEVRSIRDRFAADRRLALEGADASEKNAKQLSAGQTNLHFAVHGLVRDDRPWESALVLAPGDGEDGWLRVSEVFDLTLAADLVVLSGCSTGAGKLSGDGILGLGRAFIYAGTPSVLVSQWDVSDVATAFLMERFYAELQAGRTKAQALRAAQLAARKRYRHPALWAAFALIGEPT